MVYSSRLSALIIMSLTKNNNAVDKDCKICNAKNSVIFDYTTLESVCSNCGAVIPEDDEQSLSNIRDTMEGGVLGKGSSERSRVTGLKKDERQYDDNRQNLTRGLSTIVKAKHMVMSNGVSATSEQMEQATRLEYINNKVLWQDSSNKGLRSVQAADKYLYKLRSELNLNAAIIVRALELYKEANKKGLVKGRTVKGMTIACLYIAIKQVTGIIRPFEELSEPLELYPRQVLQAKKCYRLVVNGLDLLDDMNNTRNDGIKYIGKYITRLGLPNRLHKRAAGIVKILQEGSPTGIEGRRPSLVELCALMISYDEDWMETHTETNGKPRKGEERLTKLQFAMVANTNPVSIRKIMHWIDTRLGVRE